MGKKISSFIYFFDIKIEYLCSFFLVKRALKSKVIGRKRKSKAFRPMPWPTYLDEHRKFWFPAVKHALWELDSMCAPTERHILIAHAITNKDFGAYCLPSSSSWKMAQYSWKLKRRNFWDRLERSLRHFCHLLNRQVK